MNLYLYENLNLYVPKFKVPRKVQPKWFDSKIRFKLNCARTKCRRFRSNPTVINQLKVLAVESEVNTCSMIVSAKESYNYYDQDLQTFQPLS